LGFDFWNFNNPMKPQKRESPLGRAFYFSPLHRAHPVILSEIQWQLLQLVLEQEEQLVEPDEGVKLPLLLKA
jgi:hypothetical protein